MRYAWILFCLVVLAGCGGHGNTPATTPQKKSGVTISVKWPTKTRVIPLASDTITFQVLDSSSKAVATGSIVKPTSTWSSTALSVGNYTMVASATNSTSGPTVQATGSSSFTVKSNAVSAVNVVMGTTVTAVALVPAGIAANVGAHPTVRTACSDVNGNIVLVDPSTIKYSVDDGTVVSFTSDASATATLSLLKLGTATLTSTFSEVEPTLGQTAISGKAKISVGNFSPDPSGWSMTGGNFKSHLSTGPKCNGVIQWSVHTPISGFDDAQLIVDSHGHCVIVSTQGIYEFDGSGNLVGSLSDQNYFFGSAAFNAQGQIYVSGDNGVSAFNDLSSAPVWNAQAPTSTLLRLDEFGNIYVAANEVASTCGPYGADLISKQIFSDSPSDPVLYSQGGSLAYAAGETSYLGALTYVDILVANSGLNVVGRVQYGEPIKNFCFDTTGNLWFVDTDGAGNTRLVEANATLAIVGHSSFVGYGNSDALFPIAVLPSQGIAVQVSQATINVSQNSGASWANFNVQSGGVDCAEVTLAGASRDGFLYCYASGATAGTGYHWACYDQTGALQWSTPIPSNTQVRSNIDGYFKESYALGPDGSIWYVDSQWNLVKMK